MPAENAQSRIFARCQAFGDSDRLSVARYNAKESEKRWQAEWAARDVFRGANQSALPKCYVLEMFPYPSGRIHMGHVRNYTMGDVIARFKRAQGFNVLHPMGWDAFGLPAENAAREKGVHPREWTYANIAAMREQLKIMGLAIDWSREFATCDLEYYARQQRLFLDFFRMGLVYRAEADVNWDPVDQTVLANEQVIEGKGWRSGAAVERRKLSQWFFKITAFADDLLSALDRLERWPEKVRIMQKNWIGRSEGLRFSFALKNAPVPSIDVFSTRQDTLFGASFIALSPDHPLTEQLAAKDPKLAAFVAECRKGGTAEETIETAEKLGYDTGIKAHASVRRRVGAAGLCREFRADGLRHRRHLRLSRARSARPRFRPQIPSAGVARRGARRRRPEDLRDRRRSLCRPRPSRQLALPRRSRRGCGEEPKWPAGSKPPEAASARSTIACAIGWCRGSVIGAVRSRSSTARPAASFR